MGRLKVSGFENLQRDEKSKAIINTGTSEYLTYMRRIKIRQQQGDEIRGAVKEINNIKQDLYEIKKLLKDLGKK